MYKRQVMDVVRSIMEKADKEKLLSRETMEQRRDPPRELGTERKSEKWLTLRRQRRAFEIEPGSSRKC